MKLVSGHAGLQDIPFSLDKLETFHNKCRKFVPLQLCTQQDVFVSIPWVTYVLKLRCPVL